MSAIGESGQSRPFQKGQRTSQTGESCGGRSGIVAGVDETAAMTGPNQVVFVALVSPVNDWRANPLYLLPFSPGGPHIPSEVHPSQRPLP